MVKAAFWRATAGASVSLPNEAARPTAKQDAPEEAIKERIASAPLTSSSPPPPVDASERKAEGEPGQRCGWFRAMRTSDALDLIRANPLAYILAAVIAHRAQYRVGFNPYNRALGEALLGDHENYGMSARQYRTAKEQLAKWHFATFNATSRGTIGKLTNTRLFAIFRLESDERNDTQATSERRATDEQPTDSRRLPRTKEGKNQRTKEQKKNGIFAKTEIIDPAK